MNELNLEKKVMELRNELKTDRLDMSFGEIINIYKEGMLIIQPEYQRAYRWTDEQKTRFIESILLGIPVPPIFVAEDNEGKWELVDGLQRVSTILSFFGELKNDTNSKNLFKLTSSELIGKATENIALDTLPLKLKLTIQRAVCRVEILRWDSNLDMRYELFNRLNTGSSPLEPQEIRNCVFTGKFNQLLQELANNDKFIELIKPTDKQKETMFLEELVLRFFAFRDNYNNLEIKISIQSYLSNYMKSISNEDINLKEYKNSFFEVINFLSDSIFDYKIFRAKNGLFTPNIYDTVMNMVFKFLNKYKNNPNLFKDKINLLEDDENYQKASGASTYASKRMRSKIDVAEKIFDE